MQPHPKGWHPNISRFVFVVSCKPTLTSSGANLAGWNQLQTQHGAAVVSTGLSPSSDTVLRVGFSTSLRRGACVSWFGAKAEHTDVRLQSILLDWKLSKAWCSLSSLPSGQKWHELLIFAGTKLYQILFSQCWSWKGTWFQPGGYCAHFCSCFLLACNPSKIKRPASGELTWTHPILLSKCPMSALYRSIYKCAYESRQFVLRFTKNMSNSPCILTGHSNYFQKSIMCTIIFIFSTRGIFFPPASQVTVYFCRINCYKLS